MITCFLGNVSNGTANGRSQRRGFLSRMLAAVIAIVAVAGCQTPSAPSAPPPESQAKSSDPQTIREGDVLKVSFPGAPNLDSSQQVRRDGRITLSLVGEVKVVGKTPSDLEKELLQLYGTQLLSKEVYVTVVQSTFAVFVSGAVIRPGKITPDHPITALEAIMEAGGFDSAKANTKAVVVIRSEDGRTKNYTINLQQVLEGQSVEAFYLKPSDIVYVPEKFSWF